MIGTRLNDNSPKTILIDADSLLYFSSYTSESDQIFSETKLSEKIYDILNIIENTYTVDRYFIFVKGQNNFRYKIFPAYKSKRPKKHPIIDTLSKYLVDSFNAVQSHNAESDDYVYSYSQHPQFLGKSIICSVDKDLRQIPGIHYDYQKNRFIIISEEEGMYNLAIQMIMGDAADGIPGLKGYGIKTAEKIIRRGMSKYQMIKAIFKEYQKNCSQPQDEMRLNYKLLKLHHVTLNEKI